MSPIPWHGQPRSLVGVMNRAEGATNLGNPIVGDVGLEIGVIGDRELLEFQVGGSNCARGATIDCDFNHGGDDGWEDSSEDNELAFHSSGCWLVAERVAGKGKERRGQQWVPSISKS
ncbi:unnamed protein product [Linum trigynum]|uniref:Uncharacterized protein n=1 Tax=Linum trigynum TaxID=586398 RepID=A0AAV2G749_9ROSI